MADVSVTASGFDAPVEVAWPFGQRIVVVVAVALMLVLLGLVRSPSESVAVDRVTSRTIPAELAHLGTPTTWSGSIEVGVGSVGG